MILLSRHSPSGSIPSQAMRAVGGNPTKGATPMKPSQWLPVICINKGEISI